jgi:hypothetical protein
MLLNARNLRTVALSPAIAAEAARIGAAYQLKTPDAIQLATAKEGEPLHFSRMMWGLWEFLGCAWLFLSR